MAKVDNVCIYNGNPPAAHAQPLFGPASGDKLANQYTLDIPVATAAHLVVSPANTPTYSMSLTAITPRNPGSPAILHSIGAAVNGHQSCVFTA